MDAIEQLKTMLQKLNEINNKPAITVGDQRIVMKSTELIGTILLGFLGTMPDEVVAKATENVPPAE
jgi:hypothetical protein